MTLSPTASDTFTTTQLVVPDATPEAPVAAFVHVTEVTPTLSEAVPPRDTAGDGDEYVGCAVGETIMQSGATAS
jgi:hypothetical protein